jgi:hypothetical protein
MLELTCSQRQSRCRAGTCLPAGRFYVRQPGTPVCHQAGKANKINKDEDRNPCANVGIDSIPSAGTDDEDKRKDEKLIRWPAKQQTIGQQPFYKLQSCSVSFVKY